MEIRHGDIIRFKKGKNWRYWVAIHHSKCDMSHRIRHNKHNKNHTGFYLFSGLWYEGDIMTSDPYGKCIERLERGMFGNIEIVGNMESSNYADIYQLF